MLLPPCGWVHLLWVFGVVVARRVVVVVVVVGRWADDELGGQWVGSVVEKGPGG